MDWTPRVRRAFAQANREPDDDVIVELGQHASALYEQARADGHDPAAAEQIVAAQVVLWVREAPELTRRATHVPVVPAPPASASRFAGVLKDVRYAVRLLVRRPAPTLIAVFTMALGIGASALLFSIVSGVLLTPLPWPGSDRLVRVHETREGGAPRARRFLTNGTYLAWRQAGSTFDGLGAWSSDVVTMAGQGEPRRVRIASATASLFGVLRARPAQGTLFSEADEQASTSALISDGLWRDQFGRADDVIGRSLLLDGRSYTIVGVMARDFDFPDRETRVWIPLAVPPVTRPGSDGRTLSLFSAVARLRQVMSAQQASDEATAIARQAPDPGLVGVAVFGSAGAAIVTATPMLDAITADVRPALLVLMAAVALLLATATANVASVQLARATTRHREMAIRAAIGAGRGRIARQLLIESVLIGLAGGVAGLAATLLLHGVLPSLLPADFPRVDRIAVDGRVVAFAALASMVTGIAFGLLPAIQVRRLDVLSALKEEGTALAGSGSHAAARARMAIMIGQVAIATILLVGAALLVRSFDALMSADRGYDVQNVLSARIPMPDALYSGPRRAEIVRTVLERTRAYPGVTHAAMTSVLPLTPVDQMFGFQMPPDDAGGQPVQIHAALRTVSDDYFSAMGIRVSEGRGFTPADTADSRPVIVVNRTFARNYLRGGAVGRSLPVRLDENRVAWAVAGVVEDTRLRAVTEPAQPELYVCYSQLRQGLTSDPSIVVRTAGDPRALIATLRHVVRAEDPLLPLESVMTMDDRLRENLAKPRLYAVVLGGFAAFAVAIAAVGLFGVLSYSVAQRSREIGVRTALGARRPDIVRLVLGQGLWVAVPGVAVGLGASLILGRMLSSVLYGVQPWDPLTFIAVAVLVIAVALVACVVPARRAATIDPLQILRTA